MMASVFGLWTIHMGSVDNFLIAHQCNKTIQYHSDLTKIYQENKDEIYNKNIDRK